MSAHELEKGNISLAEECGVDDCDGQLEENSKATRILTIMNAT